MNAYRHIQRLTYIYIVKTPKGSTTYVSATMYSTM